MADSSQQIFFPTTSDPIAPSSFGLTEMESPEIGLPDLDDLAHALSREFQAPVALMDKPTQVWTGRTGLEVEDLPSAPRCFAALFAASGPEMNRPVLLPVEAPDPIRTESSESMTAQTEAGPRWLVFSLTIHPGAHGELIVAIGFDAYPDADRGRPGSADDGPTSGANWGPSCPDPALLAWGQAVVSRFSPRSPVERGPSADLDEAMPGLIQRLAGRLRVSIDPVPYQYEVCRSLCEALDFRVVAWVPNQTGPRVVLAGDRDLARRLDYATLIGALPAGMSDHVVNRTRQEDPQGSPSYAVVVDDPEAATGWLLAVAPRGGQRIGPAPVALLRATASLVAAHRANAKTFSEMKDMLIGVFRTLTSAIDAKDPYTCGHSERVARIAARLGSQLGMSSAARGDLYLMGLVHDIGKIGVDDNVLKKRGPLDQDEYRQIREHVTIGVHILRQIKNFSHLLPGVEGHHEAYDGSGYPNRLRGEEIPLSARILAVADAFDAMSSNRLYRKRLSAEKIRQIFRDGAGKQWDARVIGAMFECLDDLQAIQERDRRPSGSMVHHIEDFIQRGRSQSQAPETESPPRPPSAMTS